MPVSHAMAAAPRPLRERPATRSKRASRSAWRWTAPGNPERFTRSRPRARAAASPPPPQTLPSGAFLLRQQAELQEQFRRGNASSHPDRRATDAVPAADLRRRRARLLLAQHADDLILAELRSLHRPVFSSGRTLASDGGESGGHVISGRSLSATRRRAWQAPSRWPWSRCRSEWRSLRRTVRLIKVRASLASDRRAHRLRRRLDVLEAIDDAGRQAHQGAGIGRHRGDHRPLAQPSDHLVGLYAVHLEGDDAG